MRARAKKTKMSGRERAASMVEYALLIALLTTVCIAGIRLFGQRASTTFSTVGSQ